MLDKPEVKVHAQRIADRSGRGKRADCMMSGLTGPGGAEEFRLSTQIGKSQVVHSSSEANLGQHGESSTRADPLTSN